MELKVVDSGGSVTVSDAAFARDFSPALVHQAVTAYLAGGRSGTKAQKNRAAVAGGGAKPWRQKGTGRARAGTIRSPLWRSGGLTFAAKPRSHAQKMNRKMYRAAMRSILSELVRQERLVVVADLGIDEPRTRALVARLGELALDSALIVLPEVDRNVELASRNLPHVDAVGVSELNPVDLVRSEKVVVSVDAVKKIEEWLS